MIDYLDYKLENKDYVNITLAPNDDCVIKFFSIFKELTNTTIVVYTYEESFAINFYNQIRFMKLDDKPIYSKNYIACNSNRIFFNYDNIDIHIDQYERLYNPIKYIITDELKKYSKYKQIVIKIDKVSTLLDDYKKFIKSKKLKYLTYENI